MTEQVLAVGDKLHIIVRQYYDEDVRQHFVGEVVAIDGHLQKVRGYMFPFNRGLNEYVRINELRTRILSLGEGSYIVHVLPEDLVLEALVYANIDRCLVLTDGQGFVMNMQCFGSML